MTLLHFGAYYRRTLATPAHPARAGSQPAFAAQRRSDTTLPDRCSVSTSGDLGDERFLEHGIAVHTMQMLTAQSFLDAAGAQLEVAAGWAVRTQIGCRARCCCV